MAGGGMTRLVISAFLACLMAACQHPAMAPETGATAFAGLGGTSWRLIQVKSMDQAKGSTQPDDPDKYTLTFNADGTLAARLDCNRGVGPWRNDIAEPSGGSLAIGPLAVTRALCPPPSIGVALAGQLGDVRAFIIEDGRMHMVLTANGGILVWEPAASRQ
jgi:heat shock protein HslJ